MTAPIEWGPKHRDERPSPLDLTPAERARLEREMARQKREREEYERRQRGGRTGTSKYGPTGGRL